MFVRMFEFNYSINMKMRIGDYGDGSWCLLVLLLICKLKFNL